MVDGDYPCACCGCIELIPIDVEGVTTVSEAVKTTPGNVERFKYVPADSKRAPGDAEGVKGSPEDVMLVP